MVQLHSLLFLNPVETHTPYHTGSNIIFTWLVKSIQIDPPWPFPPSLPLFLLRLKNTSIHSFSSATDKKHESGGDERFLYGLAEMQGWRISESIHQIPTFFDVERSFSLPSYGRFAHDTVTVR